MRSCAALSKRGVIFRPMTRRSNCSISSCVRSRRIGKCRRGNGQRRKRNSPSCSTHGSSQHDGQPAPHTKYLTLPAFGQDGLAPAKIDVKRLDAWLRDFKPSKRANLAAPGPATGVLLRVEVMPGKRLRGTYI